MRRDGNLSPRWHMNRLCPDQRWTFMLNSALQLLRDDLPKFGKKKKKKSPAETQLLGQVWFFFYSWGMRRQWCPQTSFKWKVVDGAGISSHWEVIRVLGSAVRCTSPCWMQIPETLHTRRAAWGKQTGDLVCMSKCCELRLCGLVKAVGVGR